MTKKLTITVVIDDRLESAYREMAADEAREAEAVEWVESLVDDSVVGVLY